MKSVLITGANRGIGLQLTRNYVAAGWKVFATSRNPESSADLQQLANASENSQVQILKLEVTQETDYPALSASLRKQVETLDTVIANAGIYGPRDVDLESLEPAIWQNILTVNTIGPLLLAKHVRPLLQASSRFAIITSKMGSIADNTSGGSYYYRSSKAAVNAAGKSLAQDWKKAGIWVGLFHPGWVKTDMGGPNGLLTVEESASQLFTHINSLNESQSGAFQNYDGSPIAW